MFLICGMRSLITFIGAGFHLPVLSIILELTAAIVFLAAGVLLLIKSGKAKQTMAILFFLMSAVLITGHIIYLVHNVSRTDRIMIHVSCMFAGVGYAVLGALLLAAKNGRKAAMKIWFLPFVFCLIGIVIFSYFNFYYTPEMRRPLISVLAYNLYNIARVLGILLTGLWLRKTAKKLIM